MAKGKGNGAGRPLLFETPEEMEPAIDLYFAQQDANVEHRSIVKKDTSGNECLMEIDVPVQLPYTISGLARHLGFADVQSLHDYQDRTEFSGLIKKARLRIEEQDEVTLKKGEGGGGLIFVTKNRHGWADKQEHKITGEVTINFDKSLEDV